MLTVQLKYMAHRQKENIGIYYPNNSEINTIVRKLKEVRWSQTNKCWYMPLNKDSHKAARDALKTIAVVDDSLLRQYLEKKKQVVKTVVSSSASALHLKTSDNI